LDGGGASSLGIRWATCDARAGPQLRWGRGWFRVLNPTGCFLAFCFPSGEIFFHKNYDFDKIELILGQINPCYRDNSLNTLSKHHLFQQKEPKINHKYQNHEKHHPTLRHDACQRAQEPTCCGHVPLDVCLGLAMANLCLCTGSLVAPLPKWSGYRNLQ
jgi:hypothetical protein